MTDVTVKNKKSLLRTCAYTYAGKFFINYLSYPSSVIEKRIMSLRFIPRRFSGCNNGLCKTSAVISRIDTADLLALIDEPLNDCMNILDIETTEAVYHTDSELKEFLCNTHGVSNPLVIQSLEKSRRNYILKAMKDYGAGIRQLSRLTGVSYGVIQKL